MTIPPESGERQCPYCRKTIRADARRCRRSGAILDVSARADAVQNDIYESRLLDSTKSALTRTRTIGYTLLMVTAYGLTQCVLWYWGWRRAFEGSREKLVQRLEAKVRTEAPGISIDPGDAKGPGRHSPHFPGHATRSGDSVISSQDKERARLEEERDNLSLIRKKRLLDDDQVPIIGWTTANVDLPVMLLALIIGFLILLRLVLTHLVRVTTAWEDFLNSSGRAHPAQIVGLRFYLLGPFFGKIRYLYLVSVFALLLAVMGAFIVSDLVDLQERYLSGEDLSASASKALNPRSISVVVPALSYWEIVIKST